MWLLLILSIAAIAFTLTARLMTTEIKTLEGMIVRFTYISGWKFWGLMMRPAPGMAPAAAVLWARRRPAADAGGRAV